MKTLMSRLLIILGISLLQISMWAQNNDCIDAVPICSDDAISFDPRGFGSQELDLVNRGCLESNETNSAWYFFRINDNAPDNTILNFVIKPDCDLNMEDYDFAIFGPDIDCNNLGNPIRCSYAAPGSFDCALTGLNTVAVEFSENAEGDGFVNSLRVSGGETYYLMVDNFEGTGTGFTLTWNGPGTEYLDCAIVCELTFNTENVQRCRGADPFEVDLEIMSTVDEFSFKWEASNAAHLNFLNSLDIKNPIVNVPNDFVGQIIYDITVTSLDSTCFETKELIIEILDETEIIGIDTTVCQNQETIDLNVIVNNSPTNIMVEWENADGNLDWLSDFSLNPSLTIPAGFVGSTIFEVSIMDDSGFCSASNIIEIEVLPRLDLVDLEDATINCDTAEVELGSNLTIPANAVLNWSLDGSFISQDQVITVRTPGLYILEVNHPEFCTYTDTAEVIQTEGITGHFFRSTTFCSEEETEEIVIFELFGAAYPVEFFVDGILIDRLSDPLDSIVSNIPFDTEEIEVIDFNECTHIIPVEFSTPLNGTIEIGPDIEIELGLEVEAMYNSNLNPDQIRSVNWFYNDELICENCNALNFFPNEDGVLSAQLIDERGCDTWDSLFIKTFELPDDIFAPNVFSPNGDNINDRFSISGGEGVAVIEILQVYDRWGNQLYSAQNLPINDFSQGWDGRVNGKHLNPGVFVFYAKLRLTNQKTKEIKGDFTLIK